MKSGGRRLRKKDVDPNAIPREYFAFFVILLILSWYTIGYILKHPTNKPQTFKRRNLKKHERQIVFPPPKSKFGIL